MSGTAPDYSGEYRFLFVVDTLKLFTSKITTKSFICRSLQVETLNIRPIWITGWNYMCLYLYGQILMFRLFVRGKFLNCYAVTFTGSPPHLIGKPTIFTNLFNWNKNGDNWPSFEEEEERCQCQCQWSRTLISPYRMMIWIEVFNNV